MESISVIRMIVGSDHILLCIIILGRVPEFVFCKLGNVRDNFKGNLIVIMNLV